MIRPTARQLTILNRGTRRLNAPRAQAGGSYPNRPEGMTLITQWDGTSKTNTGWTNSFNANVTVIDDATNPLGTGKSLEMRYPAGATQCGSPIANSLTEYNQYYFMSRIYYDPNWEQIGHKHYYWGMQAGSRNNSTGPTQGYITREASNSIQCTQQNVSPTSNLFTAGGVWTGEDGAWHEVELLLVAQSVVTASDGAAYYWFDNVLKNSNTSAKFVRDDDAGVKFGGCEWYCNRNTANTYESWFKVGEFSIWGKD